MFSKGNMSLIFLQILVYLQQSIVQHLQ